MRKILGLKIEKLAWEAGIAGLDWNVSRIF